MEAGAKANVPDSEGFLPLHYAAQNNHVPALVKLLQSEPSTIDAQDSLHQTPLQLAVYTQSALVVQTLLSKGASQSIYNSYGNNPILIAAYAGHIDILKILLEKDPSQISSRLHLQDENNSNCANS